MYVRSAMRILTSLCAVLLATGVLAQDPPVITSITPEQIQVNSGEHFITVRGRNFWLWPRALVTISGPAGTETLLANTLSDTWLEVWVRTDIIATIGRYSVVVQNPDGGVSKPRYFEVTGVPGPLLDLPANLETEATEPDGARVTFTPQATTADGKPAPVTCSHQSGDLFRLGVTTVGCTATDDSRNTSTFRTFTITVVDTTPPVMTLPADFSVEATGPDGAQVTYEATAVDIVDGNVPVNCSSTSGATFPIGTTTVGCIAVDTHGSAARGQFKETVTKTDQPPPTPVKLHLPADITVEAMSPNGTVVEYEASAEEDGQEIPISCAPSSGSLFPVGSTTVNCSATGSQGQTANGSFQVHVLDSNAPVIHSASASPEILWPPNGKLVDITVTATAEDEIDTSVDIRVIDVQANEAIDADDWQITGALTLQLRAERNGSATSRIYTIVVEAIDDSGNASTATTTVRVPHDGSDSAQPAKKGKRRAVGK